MYRIIALIFSFILMHGYVSAQEKRYEDLSVEEFKTKLDAASGEVLLDLRTPDEIKKGMIRDASMLDYFRKDFEKQVAELDPDKTYFLYCEGGGRSAETMQLMQKLGFREVYNLKDGFAEWRKNKMPIQK